MGNATIHSVSRAIGWSANVFSAAWRRKSYFRELFDHICTPSTTSFCAVGSAEKETGSPRYAAQFFHSRVSPWTESRQENGCERAAMSDSCRPLFLICRELTGASAFGLGHSPLCRQRGAPDDDFDERFGLELNAARDAVRKRISQATAHERRHWFDSPRHSGLGYRAHRGGGFVAIVALWLGSATRRRNPVFVPTPGSVWAAARDCCRENLGWPQDELPGVKRGFSAALMDVPLGTYGSFKVFEGLLQPLTIRARNPGSRADSDFMVLFGSTSCSKIMLIFGGHFLSSGADVADETRRVPYELLQ